MPFEEEGFGGTYVVGGSKFVADIPIDRSSFIIQSINLIRELISGNITDPQSSNRASNEIFVSTVWIDKPVRYPVITIEQTGFESVQAGMQSSNTLTNIGFEINVWAKSVSQRDILAGSIFNVLEQKSVLMSVSGLFDVRFTELMNLDETGPQGLHRKMVGVEYTWPSSTGVI